ncbi:hypothetical protein COR50_15300 [Chitinophaga caeni]|uniref:DUF3347 domain-containing protein n=1 Tax=Chitinophaga caeni TaxID=2029983 RepID=A0A291QWR9_9BACT|nr:DUF3347 domain-containing protein [Chitinophaga caeni]ATL48416.1 hypothetical protein COR50_15300 [Chitinophaga caeni]
MKITSIGILFCCLAFAACNNPDKHALAKETERDTTAVLKASYPQEFYDSLSAALEAYYDLSEALVKADTGLADGHAKQMKQHMDSLPFHVIANDSIRVEQLKAASGDISAELLGLSLENTGIEARRADYQVVSDMLYEFIRATGIKGQTVYRQYCPMAFDDRGAYWLSKTPGIHNPYFGDAMPDCGSTTDTLKY